MHAAYSDQMKFLHELSLKAGCELMKYFGSSFKRRYKADCSLVTDADLASESIIVREIKRTFPGDVILSEEAGLSSFAREPGRSIWIIDPLDGTTNFSNSYPFFCVSIARAEFDGSGRMCVKSGVVHDPTRNKTFVAEHGKGAWMNGKRISICRNRLPSEAFLVTGFAYHRGEELRRDIEFFMDIAQTCQSVRRDGAAALDLALVAEGVYDGYWEAGVRSWDVAAGTLLVSEAGGTLRNFLNRPENFYDVEAGDVICGTQAVVAFISGLL